MLKLVKQLETHVAQNLRLDSREQVSPYQRCGGCGDAAHRKHPKQDDQREVIAPRQSLVHKEANAEGIIQ